MRDEKLDSNLPAVREIPPVTAPAVPPYYVEAEPEESGPPLSYYLWVLKRHQWKIIAFVFACTLATLIVSKRLTPVYEATATVDIDRQSPTSVIGEDAMRPPTADSDQFLSTQVDMIQSDSVLRPVVEKYNLIDFEEAASKSDTVSPADVKDAPVLLDDLKVSRKTGTYLLRISYRSEDPRLASAVANSIADSYIQHTYDLRFRASSGLSAFMEKQIEELKVKMEKSNDALAKYQSELNVIDPDQKTSILSSRLLQLNTEYTTAQADRLGKEAAYGSIKSGSMSAALVSSQGDALRKITERYGQAQEAFAQVQAQYGANHPVYKKAYTQLTEVQRLLDTTKQTIAKQVEVEYSQARNREAMLKQAVAGTKVEFDQLSARSFEYQALKRSAENDRELYEELTRKIKEAGINASFQNTSIRLADPARAPAWPVSPNIKLNLVLAFLLSSMMAVGAALVSDRMDTTIRDPEQVKRTLNTEVVGSLPLMKNWRGQRNPALGLSGVNGDGALVPVGDEAAGKKKTRRRMTGFDEAIRTLRNSILLGDYDRRLCSVLITSATPREGKTTTAVHLAVAHASQKCKTLLIDADLRRPGIHKILGIPNEQGLGGVLKGEFSCADALVKLEGLPDLDILPAGPPSRRAADRIGASLGTLLDEAASAYDLIIVDAPPMLGFAEPLQMAAVVDGVVVVTVAGQTDSKAVGSVLSTLNRLRAKVIGLVLNEVREDMSDHYYYYGYYGKYYSKYYSSQEA